MAFDGIVTRGIATELNSILSGGKIEKIYQPEKDEIVFQIHTSFGKKKLYTSCNSNHTGVYLSENNYSNPVNPSSFCMLLRKHLQSSRVKAVEQKDTERIIQIEFETRDELGFTVNKQLIIEIMGKHSNIILVDIKSGKIIDSVKRVSIDVNRARQILPGFFYEYPPAQDKIPFDKVKEGDIENIFDGKALLNKIQGISPLIAEELSTNPANKLKEINNSLNSRTLSPKVYFNEEKKPIDFHIINIDLLNECDSIMAFETISQAIEFFYENRDSSNRIKQKSANLVKDTGNMLKKLYLKKQRLLEDILKAENSDRYQLYGELLTANLHSLKTGDLEANLLNYYTQENIIIPLDKRFSPAKNAQIYFKKYSKAKTAIKEKQIQLNENAKDIEYMESISVFLDCAKTVEDIDSIREELIETGFLRKKNKEVQKKKKRLMPMEYTSCEGHKILVGRNNKENDYLTFKLASKKDIWFHTKDIPGSHTVLFTDGNPPTEEELFQGAALAAYHSKGRSGENIPVDYTFIKHVKKPSGAKPGMVIFTDNKTVYVLPKEL